MHNQEYARENNTHKLWRTDGSPNLGQKTKPYNNQQQKKDNL